MVVHPAYWRESHGSELSKWCMELANKDKIGLGVSAVRMGRDLFSYLGFEEVELVNVAKDEKKDLGLWICVFDQYSKAEKQTVMASTSKVVERSRRSLAGWMRMVLRQILGGEG